MESLRRGRAALAAVVGVASVLAVAGRAHAQSEKASVCHLVRESHTDVAPSRVVRASTVIVNTYLGFSCPAPIEPLHAVLVTDAALVATDPTVRADLATIPGRIVPAVNPFARLGRIDVGPGARTMCGVINDPAELALCFGGAGLVPPAPDHPDPAPAFRDGIDRARRLLIAARDDDPPAPGRVRRAARDVITIATSDRTLPDDPEDRAALCERVGPAVKQAVLDGIEVRLACADGGCGGSCLPETVAAATGSPGAVSGWHESVEELVGRMWATEAKVWQLRVRETLNRVLDAHGQPTDSPVWQVVRGSLQPPMPFSPEATSLTWSLTQPLSSTIHFSYWVRPLVEHGTFTLRQPARNAALAFITDTRGGFAVYPLDNPSLVVVGWGPFAAFLPWVTSPGYVHSY